MSQLNLQHWLLHDSYGKTVLLQLQQQLSAWCQSEHCGQFLQLGLPEINFLTEKNSMTHYVVATEQAPIIAQYPYLPFATESMDMVLLPFVLSQHADAHAILREAQRVLCAYGRLVIVDFNPYSLWRLYRQRFQHGTGCDFHYAPTPKRVADWCQLLDLQPEFSRFIHYLPWCQQEMQARQWRWLELAGNRWWPHAAAMYALLAIKHTVYLRPLPKTVKRPVSNADTNLKPVSIREPEA